ncbi:MAG: single-stranded-DNA-specific exonuclease RecJ [Eubacteriales bacterium]
MPDRQTEGYGLSVEAVSVLQQMGAKLIITVDNGVSAIEEAKLIAELGMELIITDHHKTKAELPKAVAVINPHRQDCNCKFKDFAGVGVVFKLVCAVDGGDPEELLQDFGDLLAIGTIGDVVPLVGENRTIVKQGIRAIANYPRIGVEALLNVAGAKDKKVNSSSVAYILSPRINAAGRMGSAKRALELLLADDESYALNLANEINAANQQRQKIELEIFNKVEDQLSKFSSRRFDRVIVADGDGWHSGVIGIVASRMVEKYGRPCIIISKDMGTARGSGRSLEGFSLYEALDAVSDCLTHFGGHTLAAGMGIKNDMIDEFRIAINIYASKVEMPFPIQKIDFKLNPNSISTEVTAALATFEPFGAGNPQPIFGLFGMKIDGVQPVSEGKHTRLLLLKGDAKVTAIIFNANTTTFPYEPGDIVDLAVVFENNEYKRVLSVNTQIKNIRLSELNEEGILNGIRLYEKFMRIESLTQDEKQNAIPDREMFAAIYRTLKIKKRTRSNIEGLCVKINDDGSKICAIMLALDAMLELGVIEQSEDGGLGLSLDQKKVNLDDSIILQRLK